MDGYLTELSDLLAPSQEYLLHADRVMNNVFRALQKDSKFNIDRIRPAGGAEKKTSLGFSVDNDVTAFVNGVNPPFRHTVVEDFQDVLLKNFDVKEEDMKLTRYSVGFTFDGVDFDLLVATNMAASHIQGPAWKKQHTAMLQKIASSPNQRQAATDNSAGLTETAVEFVKQQSTFVHKVARLAKFWNSTIFYTESLVGRSSIFELLGIAAGREEERQNQYNPSILRAFRLFLDKVKNIQNQRITFDHFYRNSEIPRNVLNQTPLLLDPSNPYNNFMHRFEASVQRLFSGYARESLSRLERVERQVQLNHGYPDFRSLFLPQPRPIMVGPQIGFKMPTSWLMSAKASPKYLQPNLIIRNQAVDKDKFVLKFIKKILSSFLFIADLEVSHTMGSDKVEFAKARAQEVIDDLFDKARRTWVTTNDSHSNYDVTFEIPIGREGADVLQISFMSG